MAETDALEAIGLSKRYGERHAVQGVDVVVRGGEIHGLLGPNGAGKTTLLRVLLGLVRPDAGTIRMLGRAGGTPGCALPDGVAGFVDTPRFYPYLSGRSNLGLLVRLDGHAPRRVVDDRVAAMMAEVGLEANADVKVAGYSAGMRQRLGLAAALLRTPRLLLLDEPTTSLDPAGARDLAAQLRRLAADGVAVLLSSHDMTEVEALCESVTILHRGRVAFTGPVEELRKRTPSTLHRLRTSDDPKAVALGATHAAVELAVAADGAGIDVGAGEAPLDAYVVALGQAGIAVRALEARERSLESLFLKLTGDAAETAPKAAPTESSAPEPPRPPPPSPVVRPHFSWRSPASWRRGEFSSSLRAVLDVAAVEREKLRSHVTTWAALAACLLGPVAFAAAMRLQSSLPEDTLFGRWAKASGFAIPLVVLGFAALWALPALASLVGGDLFSGEDRHGTWPTLLTRSRTRNEIFAGKVLTGLTFSLVVVVVLALSSMAAGVLVIGRQPLLSLSGTLLAPERSLVLTMSAWASVLPAVFGFTTLAVLFSTATRNGAAGIGLPVLLAFAMQLASYLNGPLVLERALLTSPLVAWRGLFTEHPFYGPLAQGAVTSSVYFLGGLTAAYLLFAGAKWVAEMGCSRGWLVVIVPLTGVLLAGCSSTGVTATKLERALGPTFANLIQTQGTLLGLAPVDIPALHVSTACHRIGPGTDDKGGGDWRCTVQWSPPGYRGVWHDSYDVSLTNDGCYTATADGEEGHLGGPRIARRDGATVTNVLYAFDGCFDPT